MKPRLIEIRQGVLSKNDQLAAELRQRFTAGSVFVLNVVSSPGSGKTTLLEKTIRSLIERGYKVAALVGDLATDNDAQRLAASGAPVRQIETAGNCHLEADVIQAYLEGWDVNSLDFLIIENVGNLVCPSSYDLGETLRVVLLSTTEGEDKPLKYPPMFNSSDVVVITKIDIAEAVEFDRDCRPRQRQARPPRRPRAGSLGEEGHGYGCVARFPDRAPRGIRAVAGAAAGGALMCLGIPGRVTHIYEADGILMGKVDFGGIVKEVCLAYVPDIQVGEYTIIHVGFAITRLDEESAQESLALFAEMGTLDQELGAEGAERPAP